MIATLHFKLGIPRRGGKWYQEFAGGFGQSGWGVH